MTMTMTMTMTNHIHCETTGWQKPATVSCSTAKEASAVAIHCTLYLYYNEQCTTLILHCTIYYITQCVRYIAQCTKWHDTVLDCTSVAPEKHCCIILWYIVFVFELHCILCCMILWCIQHCTKIEHCALFWRNLSSVGEYSTESTDVLFKMPNPLRIISIQYFINNSICNSDIVIFKRWQ